MPKTAGARVDQTFTAPTNLVATPGDQQNTLTWDAVAGAQGYNLYWHTSPSFSLDTAVLNGQMISGVSSGYVHSGLTNGTAYYYKVTAYDTTAESPGSTEVGGTPTAAAVGREFPYGIARGIARGIANG